MGEPGGLSGDTAQAKTLRGIEAGIFQPAIVEHEALGLAILKIQLAVVSAMQRVVDNFLNTALIQVVTAKEEVVVAGRHRVGSSTRQGSEGDFH